MFGIDARTKPVPGVVGNMSVTLVTVIGPLLELAIVTVKVDIPPDEIDVGANAFASIGAVAVTINVAVLDPDPVVASLLDTPVALLGKAPGVLLLMMIDTVQLPLAGIVSPLKFKIPVWLAVKLLAPAPTQDPVALPVVLINILVSVSLNAALVRAMPFELLIVKSI